MVIANLSLSCYILEECSQGQGQHEQYNQHIPAPARLLAAKGQGEQSQRAKHCAGRVYRGIGVVLVRAGVAG